MRTIKALSLTLLLMAGCSNPPQMGADKDVFATVDALFTAVTAHDARQLEKCVEKLKSYHASGKLPESAFQYLEGICQEARNGSWQSAAESLYSFAKVQRREGERIAKERVKGKM